VAEWSKAAVLKSIMAFTANSAKRSKVPIFLGSFDDSAVFQKAAKIGENMPQRVS
jgi:hypothetical protein